MIDWCSVDSCILLFFSRRARALAQSKGWGVLSTPRLELARNSSGPAAPKRERLRDNEAFFEPRLAGAVPPLTPLLPLLVKLAYL